MDVITWPAETRVTKEGLARGVDGREVWDQEDGD